ncbi:Fe-S protein assembly co-chaperone HscB [Buchnera aphidicola]|uniref:Fe-S protein assembly co-chaperone HscB n=1 Tax=Buchnera aphidicola TaxID=9 RepID=UPI0009E5D4FB|nr:Fe-S protein assembly co-chaperone HscB [Buchnera aphidicola]
MKYTKNKINYFNLFKIPQEFCINKKLLKKNFYTLQIKYHPDKIKKKILHINKKKIFSYNINQGYQILKNDFKRAIYLLKILTIKIKNFKKLIIVDQKILKKQFKLYEKIEQLKNINHNLNQILIFKQIIELKIKKNFSNIAFEFHNKNFFQVQKILYKLLFLKKILKKINLLYDKKNNVS